MAHPPQRGNKRNYAVIVGLAGLLGASTVAPGCDDITAQSFGGNATGTGGGAGLLPDGGLARGHGGTTAILLPNGGAGGRAAAAGGAGGTPASTSGTGGATISIPPAAGSGGVGATGSVTGSGGASSGGSTGSSGTGGAPGSGGTATVVKGTGGLASTGGVTSSGGVTGTGGVTSSGGVSGSGGVASAGGKAGAGSAGGSPGKPGPGSGGGGAPAAMGSGGDTQQNPDACTKLISDYDDALAAARSCDAGPKAAMSCTKSVPAALSGCAASCDTFVDYFSKPKMIQQQWSKAGCKAESCTAALCLNPTEATCVAAAGGKGTCTDTLLGI